MATLVCASLRTSTTTGLPRALLAPVAHPLSSVRQRCDTESTLSASAAEQSLPLLDSLVHHMPFVIPPPVTSSIETATKAFAELAGSTFTEILHYTPYGKQFLVQHKLSPDALVQLAFQVRSSSARPFHQPSLPLLDGSLPPDGDASDLHLRVRDDQALLPRPH